MKKIIYTAPEVMAYEIVAERGYQASDLELPGYGSEKDATEW